MTLSFHQHGNGSINVIQVKGNLTGDQNLGQVTESVMAVAQKRPGPILLNCFGVKQVDGAGLIELFASAMEALTLDKQVLVVGPSQPLLDCMERLDQQCGLEETVPVFRTQAQAIEVLKDVPTDIDPQNLHMLLKSYGRSSFEPSSNGRV